jgi:hypothetical protein
MQAEKLGLLFRPIRGSELDRRPCRAVELATPPVRQSLVGGITDEGVLEMKLALLVPLDELGHTFPDVLVAQPEIIGEDGSNQVLLERAPEHGCVAEQRSVARGEEVDPRGDQPFHGVRQGLHGPRRAGHGHQLPQEERISSGPLGERFDLVRGQSHFPDGGPSHRRSGVGG